MLAHPTVATTPDSDSPWRRLARVWFGPEHRRTRVLVFVAAILVMSLADLAMTLTYMTSVGMLESNPLARAVVQTGGPAMLTLWKLATVGLACGILIAASRRAVGEWGALLGCALLGWLMFQWGAYIDGAHDLTPALCSLNSGQTHDWVAVNRSEFIPVTVR